MKNCFKTVIDPTKKPDLQDHPSEKIAQFFDEMANDRNKKIEANLVVNYEQTMRAEAVAHLLAAQKGEMILDLGCGNARDISRLIKNGICVVGLDLSIGMIRSAMRECADAGFLWRAFGVADAIHLPFADGTFHGILCSEVLEHIPDAAAALREMWRILKPGGRVVISTPNCLSWYGFDRHVIWQGILRKPWNHPYDQWRTLATLKTMVSESGFLPGKVLGACYVPGFLATYFLPLLLQKIILGWIKHFENMAKHIFPGAAYMVCLEGVKPASS